MASLSRSLHSSAQTWFVGGPSVPERLGFFAPVLPPPFEGVGATLPGAVTGGAVTSDMNCSFANSILRSHLSLRSSKASAGSSMESSAISCRSRT